LGAEKKNLFLPRIRRDARQINTFGGCLAAGVPVDF
jgi:hypothetical protein